MWLCYVFSVTIQCYIQGRFGVPEYSSFIHLFFAMTYEPMHGKTMVWPNFFLINAFFALKVSKLSIIIIIYVISQDSDQPGQWHLNV